MVRSILRSGGRQAPALICWLLACAQVGALTLGCSDRIEGSGSGSAQGSTLSGVLASQDIGAAIYGLYHDQLASEAPGASRDARLLALEGRRADFIQAINDVVNVRTLQGAAQTADALYALIDDDTLPTLARHVADVIDLLAQDPQAMDALVQLSQGAPRHGVPPRQVVELLGRMFDYPETEQLWTATAKLIAENDGKDDQGNPSSEPRLVSDLLAFGRDGLLRVGQGASPSSTQSKLAAALGKVVAATTEEAAVRGAWSPGAPEYVVRLDGRGLPRVATDPATGRLYAPFVDKDGDGLADVDAQDAFVDAAGAAIQQPTAGPPSTPGYDAYGRAVAGSGASLFVTVDAKRTVLALTLSLAGKLLDRDLHRACRRVGEACLGPLQSDGTYGRQNPVVDLAWGGLSLLEPDTSPAVLRALQSLLQRDPSTAERLIVALGRAYDACRRASRGTSFASARVSDARVVQLTHDLLPLVDQVCEQPSAGGSSTATILVDTFADLRTTAPDFGPQLAPLFIYRSVEREGTPDADRNGIDEARSVRVDHTQPASATNRSAIQQLLDLLARADGCQLFGKSMAVWILDLMAGMSPATVGSLASMVQALPGFITNLVCPGMSQDISSLDALAKSGALDGLLPLAKAFKDRGETPLLVRILVRLQQSYPTTLRGLEPDIATMLDQGVLDEAQQVLAVAAQVRDPVTNERVCDALARGLADLVDDDQVLTDRNGNRVASRAQMLFDAVVEADRRIVAAGRQQDLTTIVDGIVEVSFARRQVNGQEVLENGSFIPLVARALDLFVQAIPPDRASRAQEVRQGQQAVVDALATKDVATLVALVRTIEQSPSHDLIRRGIVTLLTPDPNKPNDIFGGVVKLLVAVLEAPPQAGPLTALAPFGARVLDPASPLLPDAIRAFERLLTADQGKTVLTLIRAALHPAPGQTDPPVIILLDVVQAVRSAGASGGGAPFDRAALHDLLAHTSAFIHDDTSGLGYLFLLVKNRQKTTP